MKGVLSFAVKVKLNICFSKLYFTKRIKGYYVFKITCQKELLEFTKLVNSLSKIRYFFIVIYFK